MWFPRRSVSHTVRAPRSGEWCSFGCVLVASVTASRRTLAKPQERDHGPERADPEEQRPAHHVVEAALESGLELRRLVMCFREARTHLLAQLGEGGEYLVPLVGESFVQQRVVAGEVGVVQLPQMASLGVDPVHPVHHFVGLVVPEGFSELLRELGTDEHRRHLMELPPRVNIAPRESVTKSLPKESRICRQRRPAACPLVSFACPCRLILVPCPSHLSLVPAVQSSRVPVVPNPYRNPAHPAAHLRPCFIIP